MFSVVEFNNNKEKNEVGVVHERWLTPLKSESYWPPYKKLDQYRKALKDGAQPTQTWSRYPIIRILSQCDDLSEANRLAKKSEETSNLESSDEEQQMKNRKLKKRKTIKLPGEDSSDDCGDEEIHPKPIPSNYHTSHILSPPSPPLPATKTCSPMPNHIVNTPPPAKKPCFLMSEPFEATPPLYQTSCSSTPIRHPIRTSSVAQIVKPLFPKNSEPDILMRAKDRLLLGQLQETIADLHALVRAQNDKIDYLISLSAKNEQQGQEEAKCNEFDVLPMTDVGTFEEFNIKLKDENFFKQFARLLISVGGREMKTFVTNLMRRVMSCELATKFSFTGKQFGDREKLPFNKTNVYICILAAAKKSCPKEATDDAVKHIVANWLQQAKTRIARRGKGKQAEAPDTV